MRLQCEIKRKRTVLSRIKRQDEFFKAQDVKAFKNSFSQSLSYLQFLPSVHRFARKSTKCHEKTLRTSSKCNPFIELTLNGERMSDVL